MDLTARTLIAMPGMGDPRFEKSVVLLCSHSEDGAMGLIINKLMPDLGFLPLLRQLEIETGPATPRLPVHFGGPVEPARGFVLHGPAPVDEIDGTLRVNADFALTTTRDMLEGIARGEGPGQALMTLGYAGWGPGQLEGEIAQNAWLVGDATPELVFAAMPGRVWAMSLQALGIDPVMLSASSGRA